MQNSNNAELEERRKSINRQLAIAQKALADIENAIAREAIHENVGIPAGLQKRLKKCLLNCPQFKTDEALRAVFISDVIHLWRDELPKANTVAVQVNLVIDLLYSKEKAKQQGNGLVLFLRVLSEEFSPQDEQSKKLLQLAEELESAIKQSWTPLLEQKQEEVQALKVKLQELDDVLDELPRSDFVNRMDELWEITSSVYNPYVLLSAPSGYGKTELLKVISQKFREQGWFCKYVNLDHHKKHSLGQLVTSITGATLHDQTPLYLGGTIAHFLRSHLQGSSKFSGAVLIIDNIETLEFNCARDLLSEVIPIANEGVAQVSNAKFILSGRYIADWRNISSHVLWRLISLTPFNFLVVHQAIERFSQSRELSFSNNEKLTLAAHLTYLTGGHPGCIVRILDNILPGLSIDLYFCRQEDSLYSDIIRPVIDDLRNNIPADLREIFDTLSVIRRFSDPILHELIQERLIDWHQDERILHDLLTQTYLIYRTPGFLQDGVVRRLLAIRMCRESRQRFEKICGLSLTLYEKCLQNGHFRPEIIAIEFLFQKLQLFASQGSCSLQKILDDLPMLMKLISTYGVDVMDSFVELLKADWELQFNMNFFCGKNIYDSTPYTRLIEQVITLQNDYM